MIKNQLKTFALLATLTALLLWISSFWGTGGLVIGFLFAGLMNLASYWYSDKIVLAMHRARPLTKSEAPEIHRMVERLSKKAGVPKPKVYVVPSQQPNAFATGRGPGKAAIAYTEGILKLLSKHELEGVTAHELSHVKNRDVLVQTVAATVAGVISYLAFMARWSVFLGERDERNNLLGLLLMAVLAPLIATIIQLAISRSREFLADESGAKLVGSGEGLANALLKLESHTRVPLRVGNEATASLFIVNPFRHGFARLFSTHPPVNERVARLRALET